MAVSEEEQKSLLMKVNEESEEVDLKLNIQKTNIMAYGPITSWQMGKQWKHWQTSFWGGSKITVDCDFILGIKTVAPWKKRYDQPREHIKKQINYFDNKWSFSVVSDSLRSHGL